MTRGRWGHLAGALVAISTFAPWPRAGRARTDGFEFASRLGQVARVLDLATVRWVAVAWYLVPASAAVGLLAVGLRSRRFWIAAAVIDVLAAGVAATTVWAAHRVGLDGLFVGPWLALAAALTSAVAAIDASRRHGLLGSGSPVDPAPWGPPRRIEGYVIDPEGLSR